LVRTTTGAKGQRERFIDRLYSGSVILARCVLDMGETPSATFPVKTA
jgi:hypothetical protein